MDSLICCGPLLPRNYSSLSVYSCWHSVPTQQGCASLKEGNKAVTRAKGLTIVEGLSLAGRWRRQVLHCCSPICGPYCSLLHFLTVGVHHQLPLLIGADSHCIPHTQPVHLQSQCVFALVAYFSS